MGAAKMTAHDTLNETAKKTSEVFGLRGLIKKFSRLPFTAARHVRVFVFFLLPIVLISIFFHCTLLLLKKWTSSADGDSFMIPLMVFLGFGIILVLFIALFLIGVVFIVHHTSDVYFGKSTSLKELLSRSATTWKKIVNLDLSVMTVFSHLMLISTLYGCFGLVPISAANYSTAKWHGLMFFVVSINLVYRTVEAILWQVIHILEGCDDGKTLEKHTNMNIGKKDRGYLTFLMLQLCAPFCLLLLSYILLPNFQAVISLRAMGHLVVLISISQLWIYVLFTVRYHENDRNHGVKLQIASSAKLSS